MSTDSYKYFPERYAGNRSSFQRLLRQFFNADFGIIDTYHDLRAFVRQPVQEWHEGAYLSDELLDERDEILSILDRDKFILPANPTKEEQKEFADYQLRKMQTPAWQRWAHWQSKAKTAFKNHPRLEEETLISKQMLDFYHSGRNIFNIAPFLADLLKNTEVGNIRLRDIKLPYDCIYLSFEPLKEIQFPIESLEYKHGIQYRLQDLEKTYLLDGAFVSMRTEYSIDITLTFVDPKDNFREKVSIARDFRFPVVQYSLDFGKWHSDMGTTHSLDTTFNESTVCFYDIWEADGSPGELEYEKLHALTKQKEKCYESEWEEYVLMDKALKLIVNCICYLNSVDNDIEVGATNPDVYEILKQLSKTKKSQAVNKLLDKLKRFPYSKIHFCGNKLIEQFKAEYGNIELDTHWRRGHWRNQPYGSGLAQTKLIWIKPTIVRKDKGQPQIGHIYEA